VGKSGRIRNDVANWRLLRCGVRGTERREEAEEIIQSNT